MLDHRALEFEAAPRHRRPEGPRPPKIVVPLPGIDRASGVPGGSKREGQRDPGRKIPSTTSPVHLEIATMPFELRWRVRKANGPSPWRVRSLAALAASLAVRWRMTAAEFVTLTPGDVWDLRMPKIAEMWFRSWLALRAPAGPHGDLQSWLAYGTSNGTHQAISGAVSRTLYKSGAPPWRLGHLLRANRWPEASVPPALD